jgi:hypothetical protein
MFRLQPLNGIALPELISCARDGQQPVSGSRARLDEDPLRNEQHAYKPNPTG